MPKSVFDFTNYVEFLKAWIEFEKTHREGYALKSRLAKAMNISSSMMSLILKEEKLMSLEQASDLVDHLGFTELEADYFFNLVEMSHAGTDNLRRRLKTKRQKIFQQAQKISSRVKRDKELSEDVKAVFYSNWLYSGVSLLTATPFYQDTASIAKKLGVPQALVGHLIEFLLQHGLCQIKNGRLQYGPVSTHVEAESPFVNKHHQNWRVRGLQVMDMRQSQNLFFTGPVVLSKETALEVRSALLMTIEELMKKITPSPSEVPYCLNIDWFDYSGGEG